MIGAWFGLGALWLIFQPFPPRALPAQTALQINYKSPKTHKKDTQAGNRTSHILCKFVGGTSWLHTQVTAGYRLFFPVKFGIIQTLGEKSKGIQLNSRHRWVYFTILLRNECVNRTLLNLLENIYNRFSSRMVVPKTKTPKTKTEDRRPRKRRPRKQRPRKRIKAKRHPITYIAN